jgi:protein SCO1/2
VDPARDSVAALHEYVRYFSPSFRALTGDEAAVQALTLALGIPVVYHHGEGADYTVDHSVAILLVNPRGELAAVFPAPHQVRVVAADYRAIVTAAGAVPGAG